MAGTEKEWDVVGELTDDCQYIKLTHHTMLRRLINGLRGEKLRVRFSKLRMKRSDAQNRYMWGVVVPTVRAFFKETQGIIYTPDEAYTWLRIGLLGQKPEIRDVAGTEVIVMTGKRFSDMNTKEFAEATETILERMAEMGCVVPEPKQHNFITEFLQDE